MGRPVRKITLARCHASPVSTPKHTWNYIRYIQEHGSLPLASQGWEMYQPPLYYLLSAAWLGLLRLSVADPGGLMALRILGLVIGIAHFAIVWATLRMLFPFERSKAGWGILLAACLPPMLYLSQYVTNEALAAMMVSTCVWLTLRVLRQERPAWMLYTGLGLCLGGTPGQIQRLFGAASDSLRPRVEVV